MSYYNNAPWSPAGGRQGPWEQQQPPPSRPGTTPNPAQEEPDAFYYQIANVDRAIENWRKAGKMPMTMYNSRPESMPMMGGRPFNDFGSSGRTKSVGNRSHTPVDPRMGGLQRHSIGEFDAMRHQAGSGLQNFYANQRFGGRPVEADQALQAKRRMAAQRERELRNYHQEQQYQKHLSGAKSDRSMSPNTSMSEDERRELIARQHRALYGSESSMYPSDAPTSRPLSQDARASTSNLTGGLRGNSPLAYDSFVIGQASGSGNMADSAVTMPNREPKDAAPSTQRSRANSNSSPSSNPNHSSSFLFDNAQQSSRTSTSSPGGSPPRNSKPTTTSAGSVAPIGTRPTANQSSNVPQPGNLQKRSTTPLPSPLSFGFSASDGQNDKPQTAQEEKFGGIRSGWGNSGVWGSKGSLGVQTNAAWC